MRKNLFAFFSFMMFFLCSLNTAAAQETLAYRIVRQRDFFLHLNGYSDNYICDIEIIEREKSIGIILLSPEGYEQQLVFDIASMRTIYANARILRVNERDFLAGTGIHMSEAKRLAYVAKMRAAELRHGRTRHMEKPGNITPKNNSSKVNTVVTKSKQVDEHAVITPAHEKGKDHISNIKKEIEKEVAAMSTKEILERFRAEVASSK